MSDVYAWGMEVFIDESGIHKQDGVSAIAMVFVIPEWRSELEKAILEAETSLKISSFHWANHKWSIRMGFLNKILTRGFADKMQIQVFIKNNPLYYYDFLSSSLEIIVKSKKIWQITFDGQKTRRYERRMEDILRDNNISTRMLKIQNDQSSPLLRLADAMAGLTRFYFENPEHEQVKKLFNSVSRYARINTHHL